MASCLLIRMIGIDGIKFQTTLSAELNRLFQQFPLSYTPKNKQMSFCLQLLQRSYGKRYLFPYLWVSVFNNRSVKIYSYNHKKDLSHSIVRNGNLTSNDSIPASTISFKSVETSVLFKIRSKIRAIV